MTCPQCEDWRVAAEAGTLRYVRLIKHVQKLGTQVVNKLSALNTTDDLDWHLLCAVRDLLDKLTNTKDMEP